MTIIPAITDPLGRYWDQPPLRDILVDGTHAVMSQQTMSQLKNYSHTNPTGVYEGKMWRAELIHPETRETINVLRWYAKSEDPGWVVNEQRRILLLDL